MATNDDKDAFLKTDLEKSVSVATVYPLDEKRGQTILVPLHLRACEKNPVEIVAKIRAFRNMRQDTQDAEKEKWRRMSKPQKALFKENLVYLVKLRGNISMGATDWSDVAKPVLGPEEALKRRDKRTARRRGRMVIHGTRLLLTLRRLLKGPIFLETSMQRVRSVLLPRDALPTFMCQYPLHHQCFRHRRHGPCAPLSGWKSITL
mmetsp:Transcript_6043/g.10081  ORF Transcript_6043/g.10081 Transcript_6043/m.10081 type:complete len:205 (+) Transcript_6043:122-736(+)